MFNVSYLWEGAGLINWVFGEGAWDALSWLL